MNLSDSSIVAFAPNHWHGPWMNRQQLLTRLARDTTVIYSNGLWSSWQRAESSWRNAPLLGEFKLSDSIHVDTAPRALTQLSRLPMWNSVVTKLGGQRLLNFAKRQANGPMIGYIFHPMYQELGVSIHADAYVYHAYDLYERTPEWNSTLARSEKYLIEHCHLLVASSAAIADAMAAKGAKNVVVIPNGADSDYFSDVSDSDVEEPEDIAHIPRPRIGYVGNLNRKIDFSLIATLASREPAWQFVFVGGIGSFDPIAEQSFSQCERLPNVHFLGHKDHLELPRYMASMDANIMCYRMDAGLWTEASYPLKLHEYLAVGHPVVSTGIRSVRDFANVVAIADTPSEWHRCLTEAIGKADGVTVSERRRVAQLNSWDRRAVELREHLEDMLRGLAGPG